LPERSSVEPDPSPTISPLFLWYQTENALALVLEADDTPETEVLSEFSDRLLRRALPDLEEIDVRRVP